MDSVDKQDGRGKVYWLAWLGAVGSTVSILSFFVVGLSLFPEPWLSRIYMATQGILLLSLVVISIISLRNRERDLAHNRKRESLLENQLKQKDLETENALKDRELDLISLKEKLRRYSLLEPVLAELHKFSHELRDILVRIEQYEDLGSRALEADRQLYPFLQRAVDKFQRTLGDYSDPRCRTCIKSITPDGKSVLTFCRDSGSQEQYPTEQVKIDDNTDFRLIVRKERPYFLSNDLRKHEDYSNSHLNWQNDYLSTAVWPIRARKPGTNDEFNLIGFLCADSKKTDVFDENSVQIGAITADLLYIVVSHVNRLWQLHQEGVNDEH